MPQVVGAAVIAGAAGAAGAAIAGTSIAAAFWAGFVTTLISGGLSYIMREDPQVPNFGINDQGRTATVRQPTAARRIVYGKTRTGGLMFYASGTGEKHALLHLAVAWAGHECDAVEEVYVNDRAASDPYYYRELGTDLDIGFLAGASPPGTYTNNNQPEFEFTPPEEDDEGWIYPTDPNLNLETLGLTQSGQVFEVLGSGYNDGIYRIPETRGTDTDTNRTHIKPIHTDGAVVTTENFSYQDGDGNTQDVNPVATSITIREQYVQAVHRLGTDDQQAVDEMVDRLDDWTTEHRARGVCWSYVTLAWRPSKFPAGLPNVTAVVRGKKVYDPRTGLTEWSNNPALCVADYLCDTKYGMALSYADDIDEDALIAAANICDEQVPLAGGGTESRYTLNGTFTVDQPPEQVLPRMLSAMAGKIIPGGRWVIKAGAHEVPEIEVTADDLRGAVKIVPRVPRDELFNAARGVYIAAEDNWIEKDIPPITNSFYEGQDNGERIWQDMELPFTTSASMAQRLIKIELEKIRQQVHVVLPLNLTGLKIQASNTIMVTIPRYGWDQKQFYVYDWTFEAYEDENGELALGTLVKAKETAAGIFDWNSGEETTVDLSPDTNLPDAGDPGNVQNLEASSGNTELLLASDGTVVSRIRLIWDPPDLFFDYQYDVRWRRSADDVYQVYRTRNTSAWLAPVADQAFYDMGVRAVETLYGATSGWEEITNYQVEGKTARPTPPDTFTFLRQQDGTREFQWTHANPAADVRVGGGYQLRYRLGTGWTWDDMTPLHDGLLTAAPWETNLLAAGQYTFELRTVDSSGNTSETGVQIVAELGDPRGAENSIHFEDLQNSGWPGTRTDCVVDGQLLRARNQDTWGTLPSTWSAWTSWVSNPVGTFTYEPPEVDLGVVATFVPLISADSDSSVTIEVRHRDSTGDSWSAWQQPGTSVEARYLQVRVIVTQTGSELPLLYGMTVNLSARPVDEQINDLDTSNLAGGNRIGVGDIRLPISQTFAVIRTVQIALQNVGAGWSWDIVDKDTATGPRVRIFDDTGSPADANIDAFIRGL